MRTQTEIHLSIAPTGAFRGQSRPVPIATTNKPATAVIKTSVFWCQLCAGSIGTPHYPGRTQIWPKRAAFLYTVHMTSGNVSALIPGRQIKRDEPVADTKIRRHQCEWQAAVGDHRIAGPAAPWTGIQGGVGLFRNGRDYQCSSTTHRSRKCL